MHDTDKGGGDAIVLPLPPPNPSPESIVFWIEFKALVLNQIIVDAFLY